MKKLVAPSAAVLAALLLGSCSSDVVTVNSVENTTSHSASMRYDSFDGTKEYALNVKEGALPLTVAVEIVTDSGNLALSIEKTDGTDRAKQLK